MIFFKTDMCHVTKELMYLNMSSKIKDTILILLLIVLNYFFNRKIKNLNIAIQKKYKN